MTSISRRYDRRLPLKTLAIVAGLITMASMPTRGAAQSAPSGGAQGGMQGGSGGGGGRMMATVMQGITLTDAQQKSVDGIRATYQPQMQAARESQNRDQMRTLSQQQMADIRKVLTPDQQVIFDKNLATARANMQNGQGGGGQPH
jgi:Spy/CpxP family protein refolding chaperone